jgi:glycosyltransferase involved in cell wall biosynthesis
VNSQLPLSVSIIAKNEANNLRRCLSSLHGIASEIVVVHNDCTDTTVEVAKSFGAKCFDHDWRGHVEQKNIALSKCSNQWILCLDADEALSDRLRDSIVGFLENTELSDVNNAVKFNRCSFFLGKWIKHGDWYPDTKVRLVKKNKATWGGINPHDKLSLKNNEHIFKLDGDLEHYSFVGIRDLTQKSIRYSDLFVNYNADKTFSPGVAVLRALWRFFRCYLLRLGFLDGSVGFIIAFSIAQETLLKHGRCRDNQDSKE